MYTQAMLVFNVRADQAAATGGDGCVRALTASIEEGLTSYVSAFSSTSNGSQSNQQPPSPPPPILLLPSFTGDFTRAEAGKALGLHLVAHMRPLDPDVSLIPDQYRCVFIFIFAVRIRVSCLLCLLHHTHTHIRTHKSQPKTKIQTNMQGQGRPPQYPHGRRDTRGPLAPAAGFGTGRVPETVHPYHRVPYGSVEGAQP